MVQRLHPQEMMWWGTMLGEGVGAQRRVKCAHGVADTTQAVECHLLLSGDHVSSAKGMTLRGLPNMEGKTGMSSVALHLLSQAKGEQERGLEIV